MPETKIKSCLRPFLFQHPASSDLKPDCSFLILCSFRYCCCEPLLALCPSHFSLHLTIQTKKCVSSENCSLKWSRIRRTKTKSQLALVIDLLLDSPLLALGIDLLLESPPRRLFLFLTFLSPSNVILKHNIFASSNFETSWCGDRTCSTFASTPRFPILCIAIFVDAVAFTLHVRFFPHPPNIKDKQLYM